MRSAARRPGRRLMRTPRRSALPTRRDAATDVDRQGRSRRRRTPGGTAGASATARTDPTRRRRGRERSGGRRSRDAWCCEVSRSRGLAVVTIHDVHDRETPLRRDPATIQRMFASIASRYDRANTVISGGVHHLWRRRAVRRARVQRGDAVLDCATGTGDLAIAFKRAVGPGGRVVGPDFTPELVALAHASARDGIFEVADVASF